MRVLIKNAKMNGMSSVKMRVNTVRFRPEREKKNFINSGAIAIHG